MFLPYFIKIHFSRIILVYYAKSFVYYAHIICILLVTYLLFSCISRLFYCIFMHLTKYKSPTLLHFPAMCRALNFWIIMRYTTPCANIAVAQGLSVYAVFAFICILLAYYQRSPFRLYTILHRFRLSVNMQMNRIRFCLRIPHNTNVFRCRLCSNHNTVPMIRLALKWLQFYRCRLQLSGTDC